MFNILQKYTKTTFVSFFLIVLTSCKPANDKQTDLTLILQASFEKIYYAKYALDFPHTEDALRNCIEYQNKACLDVYKQYKEGKEALLSLSDDNKSLTTTLDIIEQACLSKDETMAINICYGGLMSLYFYNSAVHDQEMFLRIKKYPKKINSIIFNHNFLWFHNRPKQSDWVKYISKGDVNWEQDGQKQFVLDMFSKDINQVGGEPWVLR